MLVLVGVALPVAATYLLLQPARHLGVSHACAIALAIGIGLGLASCTFFLALVLFDGTRAAALGMDVAPPRRRADRVAARRPAARASAYAALVERARSRRRGAGRRGRRRDELPGEQPRHPPRPLGRMGDVEPPCPLARRREPGLARGLRQADDSRRLPPAPPRLGGPPVGVRGGQGYRRSCDRRRPPTRRRSCCCCTRCSRRCAGGRRRSSARCVCSERRSSCGSRRGSTPMCRWRSICSRSSRHSPSTIRIRRGDGRSWCGRVSPPAWRRGRRTRG